MHACVYLTRLDYAPALVASSTGQEPSQICLMPFFAGGSAYRGRPAIHYQTACLQATEPTLNDFSVCCCATLYLEPVRRISRKALNRKLERRKHPAAMNCGKDARCERCDQSRLSANSIRTFLLMQLADINKMRWTFAKPQCVSTGTYGNPN